MDAVTPASIEYSAVVDDICALNWSGLERTDITTVAWAYYYFSVQFRENLRIACHLYPDDRLLKRLVQEECNTANLSPWLGVLQAGEKVNHDEFIRRILQLTPIDPATQQHCEAIGLDYLARMRTEDDETRAMSIASFEDGGLERVFTAILTCQCWDTPLLRGFRHFLMKHIDFDSYPDGHGALARHLKPDQRIRPLWVGLYRLFVDSVPHLKGLP